MRVYRANAADSEKLKEFLKKYPIPGSVEVCIERQGDYFAQYELQSQQHETYILKDRNNKEIQGTATILFRQGQIEGKQETIGFASDLRISSSRKAIVSWTQHFRPLMEDAMAQAKARFMFSILPTKDALIQNTLVRPRAQRRHLPLYRLVRRFDVVSLHGHWPFFYDKLTTIQIKPAELNDLEAIAAYLRSKSHHRPLSFDYTAELLSHRIQNWPGLQISSFLLARDKRGNIRGCVAPWTNDSVQRLQIQRYGGFAHTARGALKFGAAFKFTTPLPQPGGYYKFQCLTHLNADNPDIFDVLLEEAWHRRPVDHTLVYTHFHRLPMTMPPNQFFYSKTPLALFVVTPGEEELPFELLNNPIDRPPELELCLI